MILKAGCLACYRISIYEVKDTKQKARIICGNCGQGTLYYKGICTFIKLEELHLPIDKEQM